MDEHRRKAWEEAIAKLDRGETVPEEDHSALLRENMFKGDDKVAIYEEANLFLRYWYHANSIKPIPWLGEPIANYWFRIRDLDRQSGKNRAEKALRKNIDKNDFDHWTALNTICARLHRERQPFPDILADWAAELHEGKRERPPKEKGDQGRPPYAHEDRNRVYANASDWLKYYGMAKAEDRIGVIAHWSDVDETVVLKGLTRWRKRKWRPAPWPKIPRE